MAGFDGVSSFVNNEGSQLNFYVGLNPDSLSLGGGSTGRRPHPPRGPLRRSVG